MFSHPNCRSAVVDSWADKSPSEIVADIEGAFALLGGNQPAPVFVISRPAQILMRRLMRQMERRSMSKRAFYRRRARGQLQWW